MKQFFLLSCFLCLVACYDNIAHTDDVSEVQDVSSMQRFERFIATFPSVELPYSLDIKDNYPSMPSEFLEHILKIPLDPQIGPPKTVECIATFKAGTHLAVLYKWSERPITKDNPSFFELAVYSPYGALRKSIVLGQHQQENDAYKENFNLRIGTDFVITTEHYATHFLNTADKYDAFYTNEYKIEADGSVSQTKTAELWEKIPAQFTPSFVESYKKNPSANPTVKVSKDGDNVVLENPKMGYSKAIIKPFLFEGKQLLLVSSLDIEAYSQTQTTLHPYFVNSRVTILKFSGNQFEIVTNEILDNNKWKDIYAIIKPACACEPAPNVNDKGIVGLTLLEEVVSNAVFIDLDENNKLVLKCRKEDKSEIVVTNL